MSIKLKRCRFCNVVLKNTKNIAKKHRRKCILKTSNLKKFFRFFSAYDYTMGINSRMFNYYNPPIPRKADLRVFYKENNILYLEQVKISYYNESNNVKIYQLFLNGLITNKLKIDDMQTHLRFLYDRYGFLTKQEYSAKMKVALEIENWLLGKSDYN